MRDRVSDLSGDSQTAPIDERAVLDVLAHAVVVTDPTGTILLWNRSAEDLYGWSEEEVLGRSVVELLTPPGDEEANRRDLHEVASGTPMSGDRLVTRRGGELVRVRTFTRPLLDDAGRILAVVGGSEDVGALRDAEQNARDLSEHFRSAVVTGGLGTWRWHMRSGQTIWDERLEALFGLSPGEFDGTFDTYVSLIHPDDRERVLATVSDAVDEKTTYRTEHRVVWPDGSVHSIVGVGGVTLDASGEVTGTVGCSMDVTDRVELEQERQRLADLAILAASRESLLRERLEFLSVINDALNASGSVREVMTNVTRLAVPRLGDWCVMYVLPNDGRPTPEVEVSHVDPGMVRHARGLQQRFPYQPDAPRGVPAVVRTGVTEFYPEISDQLLAELDVADDAADIIDELDIRSTITVAMKKRGRVVGALQFVAGGASRRYTSEDVTLAETIAGRVASSIENLRLHDEQREIAWTLQRSLLPDALADVPRLDTSVRYWANGQSTEVGGDFYDLFALDTAGRFGLVLGDVCGTGPAAAALIGLARHTIRDSAWHGDEPRAILDSLNRAIRRSRTDTFLTCVYAALESSDEYLRLTLACAGHPLPVVVRGTSVDSLGRAGRLLGVFDEIDVNPTTVELSPGDVVVFHTDGATDVPPPHDLDEQAWRALVLGAARPGGSAEAIAERIEADLDAVLPFESRHDDIALLVLVVLP